MNTKAYIDHKDRLVCSNGHVVRLTWWDWVRLIFSSDMDRTIERLDRKYTK
jgi:hypothetical protein